MSRRVRLWGALAVLAGAPAGCADDEPYQAPIHVDIVYDPEIDFSDYRSFAVRSDADADSELLAGVAPESQRDLRQANALVAGELRDRGVSPVAADDADLLAFSLARTTAERALAFGCVSGVWGGYWYWDYEHDPCTGLEPASIDVDATTLMLGLLDPEREQVVFAGFVSGIGGGAGPDSRDRDIASGVARVFARYPGRPAPLFP